MGNVKYLNLVVPYRESGYSKATEALSDVRDRKQIRQTNAKYEKRYKVSEWNARGVYSRL